jgi:predicted small secreted protein
MSQAHWENLASLASICITLVAAIALLSDAIPERWLTTVANTFHRRARSASYWLILIPAISLCINVAITVYHGTIPSPKIHDEFSYLLAADTFAHGRLTNPSPPYIKHFETPQELMQPTRMSKYPPGQGLFMSLGQLVNGEPILGVWISTALACMAIYWMLLTFVRLPWALLGGLLACVHPQLLDWSQVYWGGSVAVLGGALTLGAWGRLMQKSSAAASSWFGIGLVILACSRPYEGLVLSLPMLISLLIAWRGEPRAYVPAVTVVLFGLLWLGYYNHQVTGQALRMPIQEYSERYDVYPKFWLLPRRPEPAYHNPSQRWVHTVFEKGSYDTLRTLPGLTRLSIKRTWDWINASTKLAAVLPLLAIGFFTRRDRRMRWLSIICAVFLAGLWAESFVLPHYTAPAFATVLLLITLGWDRLWHWGRTGRSIAFAIAIGCLAGSLMAAAQPVSSDSQIVNQQALIDRPDSPLNTGRHIVFVRYEPGYHFDNEFVYNSAELPSNRIIWAHYFGPREDAPVSRYFGPRQIWLLDAGEVLNLQPYSMPR